MTNFHYKLFKPYGYLSQFVNNTTKRKNKKLLGELFPFPDGTMAIGRLDEPSEGLLLLTTDGKLSEYIRSAKVEKEYYVQVDGAIDAEALEKLKYGVLISTEDGPYTTLPAAVALLGSPPILPERAKKIRDVRHGPTTWISIVISEGKFRQVRKMTAAVGYPTLRLVRFRIGTYTIESMEAGEVIKIHSPKY
ncbi:MAG: 23S rRNA pseudouridine2457 synthase [Flavobacteriales bacterium]